MVDSMNARRGAKKYNKEEYIKHREGLRKQFTGIFISKYYESLDDVNVKTSNEKQREYLEIAAKIALKSPMGHKHGAVVVYKNKIIASGHNYYISDFSIHAEVAALSGIKGKNKHILPECELYVVRIGPDKYDNPLKYSKPCFNCQHTILKHNIKKAFYSTNYDYDIMKTTIF
jgi:deoxycytidylate deaminase